MRREQCGQNIFYYTKNKLQESFTRELESLCVCLSVRVCGVVGELSGQTLSPTHQKHSPAIFSPTHLNCHIYSAIQTQNTSNDVVGTILSPNVSTIHSKCHGPHHLLTPHMLRFRLPAKALSILLLVFNGVNFHLLILGPDLHMVP